MTGLLRPAAFFALLVSFGSLIGCQSSTSTQTSRDSHQNKFSGVLMWKGDSSGAGQYSSEATLTPANVNGNQFGRTGTFTADGLVVAQPLYLSGVSMPTGGAHDIVIIATEHDSVYAIDADSPSSAPLWERHFVDPASGVTTLPDNFGGRTTLGGEVGITGTPVIDPATGALYFVTTLSRNGVAEQWLHAIDITSGQDFGPGAMQIQASVPGDGVGSVNGQIAFDPSIENQRPGLVLTNGVVLVAWGAFSDWGVYHGWLMAFDPATLQLRAAFNPTTQYQANDVAYGPADHGGGGAFWQGGAAPAIDSDGNIFINASDGSFNADQGGTNYGDSLLKLQFTGSAFQVLDSFTPANADCIDLHDLELGSGGVVLLPTDVTNGTPLAAAYSKEGRLFLVNRSNLGHFNVAGDAQIPQELMVGQQTCSDSISGDVAEGPDWNRLYGNPAYWNGNLYAAASSLPLKQYQFQGGVLNTAPFAMSPTAYGLRGGNIVISSNGTQNGIVWAYEKSASSQAILHAYDATDVSKELWNSNMNGSRDGMGTGISFGIPCIAEGRVVVTADETVSIFGVVQ